jgi:phage-related minor tail protein
MEEAKEETVASVQQKLANLLAVYGQANYRFKFASKQIEDLAKESLALETQIAETQKQLDDLSAKQAAA